MLYYLTVLFRYTSDKNGKPVKAAVIYTETEHCIKKKDIDPDALQTILRLKSYGYEAYIVGGAVRDLLLQKKPKDFDLVTDATPSHIKKIFRSSYIIGKRFRIVHVFFGPKIFEVTTFRSIAGGTTGNAFGTIDEDVHRRDFTLNALYYDPLKNYIIDYVGGVKDIRMHKLVPVIPLTHIFTEDPVRMIRAVKYAASTGFTMPRTLKHKIQSSVSLLSPVSPSRLTEELIKIISSGCSQAIVKQALDTGLYIYLQPNAAALIYEKKDFEASYFASLAELDALQRSEPEARLGKKLVYLIRDFMDSLTDWKKEIEEKTEAGELYALTWQQCRSFVLPMNPQRSELDYAVRFCLKERGVPVRAPKAKKNKNTK